MSVAVEWISLRRPTQQAGPSSSVVGRRQPGDSVDLGSGKGPPSVALLGRRKDCITDGVMTRYSVIVATTANMMVTKRVSRTLADGTG